MNFYTDIDYVLHDFDVSFIEAIRHLYGLKMKIKQPNKRDKIIPGSLYEYINIYNLDEKMVSTAVRLASEKYIDWHPCNFSRFIVAYLKEKLNNGDKVISITSRENRWAAEKMMWSIFKQEIPVISSRNENKYLSIEEKSVFFEDNPFSINGVISSGKDVQIIIPKWPWNKNKVPNLPNIHHIDQDDFKNFRKVTNHKNFKRSEKCLI